MEHTAQHTAPCPTCAPSLSSHRDVGEFQVGSEPDALVFYLMARPPDARSLPPSAADLQAAAWEPAGTAAAGKGAAGRAAVGEGTLLRDEL